MAFLECCQRLALGEHQPEDPGGDDDISQAESNLVREPPGRQKLVGEPDQAGLGGQEQDVLEAEPGPAGEGCQSCLGIGGDEAAGGLRADGHEAPVEGHDQQVEQQPEGQDPHAGQAPVEPAEDQESRQAEDQPESCQSLREPRRRGQVGDQQLGEEGEDGQPGLAQRWNRPGQAAQAGKQQPGQQASQDGSQQDHFI